MRIVAIAALAASLTYSINSMAQGTSPRAIVYKTRANYRNLVPVILSDDGSRIVSYPAIEDIKAAAKPEKLAKGYLLDNGGRVNKHVAFLKLSYEQYAALAQVPTLTELYDMLVDKTPLVKLYDCGIKGEATSKKKLNKLIRKNELARSCVVLE